MGSQTILSLSSSILGPSPKPWARSLSAILSAFALVGVLVVIVFEMVTNSASFQRDLRTYYSAASAFKAGLDPYDRSVLAELSGGDFSHSFVYPPLALVFFLPLSEFEFTTVYYLFLAAKLIALFSLFWVWKKHFVHKMGATFFLFVFCAFNATLYVDIQVGNISVFEQALIWLGVHFLLTRKPEAFAALLVLAASFKFAPIAFLGLLLLDPSPRKSRTLVISLAGFLLLQAVSYAAFPDHYRGFVVNLGNIDERGVLNPSTFALLADAFDLLGALLGQSIPAPLQTIGFLTTAAIVFGLSIRQLRMYSRSGNLKRAICLAMLIFALAVPRFKAYSYILLIVPTYLIVSGFSLRWGLFSRVATIPTGALVILMTMVSSLYLLVFGDRLVEGTILGYSPLLAAFIAWGLYLIGRLRPAQSAAEVQT